MKKAVTSVLMVLMGMVPGIADAALARLEIGYTAPQEISRAMLYVNGRYKGFIYKNRSLTVMVETGRSHVVRVFRQEGGMFFQKTEIVRFAAGEALKSVTLALQKKAEVTSGKLRLRIAATMPFDSARLFASGVPVGMVYRDRTVSFTLPVGQVTIEVRRVWQGKNYRYASKLLVIGRMNEFRSIVLKTHSAIDPDGGKESRALLRIKLEKGAPMPEGTLYLNKRYLGTVYRDKYSNYTLEPGEAELQVRRIWNGVAYASILYKLQVHAGRRMYLLVKMSPE